jgi:nucleoid-associated protein EbfC
MAGTTPAAGDLTGQVGETQRRVARALAELAETELTRTAGGGLVTATMSGHGELTRLAFDPARFVENDAESLGALTRAAINQATDAVKSAATEKLMAAVAGLQAALTALSTGLPGSRPSESAPVADVAGWALVARVVNDQMAERGMTQRELARRSGVSAATLRKIQRGGEQRRSRATLVSVSRALGLPDDHLWRVSQGAGDPGEAWSDDEMSALRGGLAD